MVVKKVVQETFCASSVAVSQWQIWPTLFYVTLSPITCRLLFCTVFFTNCLLHWLHYLNFTLDKTTFLLPGCTKLLLCKPKDFFLVVWHWSTKWWSGDVKAACWRDFKSKCIHTKTTILLTMNNLCLLLLPVCGEYERLELLAKHFQSF